MDEEGSVPPIRFDRRFDKPPQRKKQKLNKRKIEPETTEPNDDSHPRPEDPDNPSTIDITA